MDLLWLLRCYLFYKMHGLNVMSWEDTFSRKQDRLVFKEAFEVNIIIFRELVNFSTSQFCMTILKLWSIRINIEILISILPQSDGQTATFTE